MPSAPRTVRTVADRLDRLSDALSADHVHDAADLARTLARQLDEVRADLARAASMVARAGDSPHGARARLAVALEILADQQDDPFDEPDECRNCGGVFTHHGYAACHD